MDVKEVNDWESYWSELLQSASQNGDQLAHLTANLFANFIRLVINTKSVYLSSSKSALSYNSFPPTVCFLDGVQTDKSLVRGVGMDILTCLRKTGSFLKLVWRQLRSLSSPFRLNLASMVTLFSDALIGLLLRPLEHRSIWIQ